MPRPAISSPPAAGASTQCEAGALPVPQAPLAQTPDKESKSNKAAAQQLINKAVKKSAPTLPAQAKVTPLAPTGATAAASSSMSKRQIRKQQELAATLKQNVYALLDDDASTRAHFVLGSAKQLKDLTSNRFCMELLTEDCELERKFTRLLSTLSAATKLPPSLQQGVGAAATEMLVTLANTAAGMLSVLALPGAGSDSPNPAQAQQLQSQLSKQLASPHSLASLALGLHVVCSDLNQHPPEFVSAFKSPFCSVGDHGEPALLAGAQEGGFNIQLPDLGGEGGADLHSMLTVLLAGMWCRAANRGQLYTLAQDCLDCLHCGLFHLVHKQPRHPLLPELLECALVAVSAWAQLMAPTLRGCQARGPLLRTKIKRHVNRKLAVHVAQVQWLWTTAFDSRSVEVSLDEWLRSWQEATSALASLMRQLLFELDDTKVIAALHMLYAMSHRCSADPIRKDLLCQDMIVKQLLYFDQQFASQLGHSPWEHSPSLPAMAIHLAVAARHGCCTDTRDCLSMWLDSAVRHLLAHGGQGAGGEPPDRHAASGEQNSLAGGEPPDSCAASGAPQPLTSWAADAVAIINACLMQHEVSAHMWRLMVALHKQQVRQRRARAQEQLQQVQHVQQSQQSGARPSLIRHTVPHQQDAEAMGELYGGHSRLLMVLAAALPNELESCHAACVVSGCSILELALGRACFALDLTLRDVLTTTDAVAVPVGRGGAHWPRNYAGVNDVLLGLQDFIFNAEPIMLVLGVEASLLREELVALVQSLLRVGPHQQPPLSEAATIQANKITVQLQQLK